MADFSSYGGPSDEWLAVEASMPSPVANQTLEEKKRVSNEGREKLAVEDMKPLASLVRMQDHSIPARDGFMLEARSYRPSDLKPDEPLPVYMHLHGGGFLFGTLASEDAICSRIAVNARVVVLNVNYRHTPEYVYPTAWNDGSDAFEWIHDNIELLGGNAQQVILGGISAGAWITASMTLQKQLGRESLSRPKLAGQVLMIPCVVHMDCYEPQLQKMRDQSISSYTENRDAPILPVKVSRMFTDLLKVENPDPTDLKLSPGNATPSDVKGMPPTVFGITGLDPLRDEGLLYAKMLTEAG
jgi:acetyl esterase/lipase